jgi:hypothetical protein
MTPVVPLSERLADMIVHDLAARADALEAERCASASRSACTPSLVSTAARASPAPRQSRS